MRTTLAAVIAGSLALLGVVPQAAAQKSTEIYIPIGKSPGLSGRQTIIGRVTAMSDRDQTITVQAPGRSWTGSLTKETRVYLDRSALRLTNLYGKAADCPDGALVEIKYASGTEPGKAKGQPAIEWMKIQVTEAPRPAPRPKR